MFKRIEIQNFRSCTKVCIDDPGPLVVLLGRNGAGKTTILQAIDWLARTATLNEPVKPFGPRLVGRPTKFSVEFTTGDTAFRFQIEVNVVKLNSGPSPARPGFMAAVSLNETLSIREMDGNWEDVVIRNGEKVQISGENELRIPHSVPCLSVITSILPEQHKLSAKVRTVISFLGSVRYYPLDEASKPDNEFAIISEDEYAKWLARYTSIEDAGQSIPMRLLHMSLEQPEKFGELKDLIGQRGLRIIDDISIDKYDQAGEKADSDAAKTSRRFYVLRFHPSLSKDSHVVYSQLSLGTRRVLRMLASMIFDGSSVMLVEQLEDGIHSALLKKLIGVLRTVSDSVQLVVSSHSSDVFNKLTPNEVRLVSMRDGKTELRSLNSTEVKAALTFIDDEGCLSDFLEIAEGE
jgi:predicted ATPase